MGGVPEVADLLKFWRALETFTHPEITISRRDKLLLSDKVKDLFEYKIKKLPLFGIEYSVTYLSLLLELNIYYKKQLDVDLIYDKLTDRTSFVYKLNLSGKDEERDEEEEGKKRDIKFRLNLAVWATGKALSTDVEKAVDPNDINIRLLVEGLKEATKTWIRRNRYKTFILILNLFLLSPIIEVIDIDNIFKFIKTEFGGDIYEELTEIESEEKEELYSEIIEDLKEHYNKVKKSKSTIYLEFTLIENAIEYVLKYYLKKRKKITIDWLLDFHDIILRLCYFSDNLFKKQKDILIECLNSNNEKVKEISNLLKEVINRQITNSEGFFYKNIVTFKSENVIFENFYIEDLYRLEKGVNESKNNRTKYAPLLQREAFRRYLFGTDKERIDVRNLKEGKGKDFILTVLHPNSFPSGAWPSTYPLVFSQQVAVNTIWRDLRDREGLFSINGPPGTGKTTLLRDLVAGIVTERARRLVEFIESGRNIFTDYSYGNRKCYKLVEELSGFSIVVASSNNSAVENVSLEWPLKKAVTQEILEEFIEELKGDKDSESIYREEDFFFGKLASNMYSENMYSENLPEDERKSSVSTWGLISSALGKKENREKFVAKILDPVIEEIKTRSNEGEIHYRRLKELCKKFRELEKREKEIKEELSRVMDLYMEYTELKRRIERYKLKISESEETIARFRNELSSLKEELEFLKRQKPGLLEILLILGKEYLKWKKRIRALEEEIFKGNRELSQIEEEYKKICMEKEKDERKKTEIEQKISIYREKLGKGFLPEKIDSEGEEERELSAPWHFEEWRRVRIKLFLLSLELQRTLIFARREFLENLELARTWLRGGREAYSLSDEQVKIALESLSFLVPVISTTFASVGRMFYQLKGNHIGWLLIDEAGQAQPHHAVGAISRAKRVVVVGDPLQLEPVCPLSSNLIEVLSTHYRLRELSKAEYMSDSKVISDREEGHRVWHPNESSCQRLADLANPYGTMIKSLWIGAPLRVHRRCCRPMFDICNEIAYDGLMVYGVGRVPEGLLPSCWIDVKGTASEDSHFIEKEGDVLLGVLEILLKGNWRDIYILSPFRSCADACYSGIKEKGFHLVIGENRVGTVHVAQGREADVVILVMGGNPSRPGALAWATSKPNLFNVAVSRAKKYLYVIGDLERWKKYKYIDIIEKHLNKVVKPEVFVIELKQSLRI